MRTPRFIFGLTVVLAAFATTGQAQDSSIDVAIELSSQSGRPILAIAGRKG